MLREEIKNLLKKVSNYAEKKNVTLYLVGGFLRDYFLRIPTTDIDFVVTGNAEKFARRLAKIISGSFVLLDKKNKIYRIAVKTDKRQGGNKIYHLDFSQMQGKNIQQDLSRRDFTINSLALPITHYPLPITHYPKKLIDPYNGIRDLRNKVIRKVSDKVFVTDSLRLLRAFRHRAELQFKIETGTLNLIKKQAQLINHSAKERIRDELYKIFATKNATDLLQEIDRVHLLKHIFPEIEIMKKSAHEFYFHPQGLWQHSLESLKIYEKMLNNAKKYFHPYTKNISAYLEQKLPNGIPRGILLKFIILFHDVAKPQTARPEGERTRFFGHERKGAKLIKKIFNRLRFSKNEINIAEKLVRYHMRPGNLTQLPKVTNRALYRYFRDLGNEGIDLLIVSLADRYSYMRISKKPQEIRAHHRKTLDIFKRYYEEKERILPTRLLNGYEVMKICRIPSGPKVGEFLRLIEEKQAEGKIKTKEEAKQFLVNLTKTDKIN